MKKLVYSMIPYSLFERYVVKKCGLEDGITVKGNLDKMKVEDAVAFFPYCSKPMNCPSNTRTRGRKSQDCRLLNGRSCDAKCTIRQMLEPLLIKGMQPDNIFIIDSDENLFPWLNVKRKEGYKYVMPGVGCVFGIGYAYNYVFNKLGFEGIIIPIAGDYCKGIDDYMNMETYDKGKKTYIDKDNIIKFYNKYI